MAAEASSLLLLAVWVLSFDTSRGQMCVSGFADLNDLIATLQTPETLQPRYSRQRLIPDMQFTCNGAITKWTVGAGWCGNCFMESPQFPHLQIWRNTLPDSYILVGSTVLSATVENPNKTYDFIPSPALEFQAGDVLGIFQPREEDSRLFVYYEQNFGPINYFIDTRQAQQPPSTSFSTASADGAATNFPLVSVEIRINCLPLGNPDNGIESITVTPGGTMEATYTCNEGYEPAGTAVLACQVDGQWNGVAPTCMLIDCGGLSDPEEGRVTFNPGVVATIDTGLDAVATYVCNDGYDLVGDELRTCQGNGLWSGAEPTCMLIDCGGLDGPDDGQVTITPGVLATTNTGLNATATYTCNEGYDLVGNASRVCLEGSQWFGAEPTCIAINCGNLTEPNNGQVTTSPGLVATIDTGLNATATYTCNEGYDLVGIPMRTCQANSQWDGVEPICTLIDCGGLVNPGNGQVAIIPGLITVTGFSATATYTCNTSAGYILVGTVTRTCQDSGQWSGMVPECIRCNTSSITAPEMGNVAITSPGEVITAVYTCDVGYTVVGVATRTCQPDGQFSGQEPTCQVVDCGVPPPVDNGHFNVTATTFESTAEYCCNEGFTLSGSQSRTCQANGAWSGAAPTCAAPLNSDANTQLENLGPTIGGAVGGFMLGVLVTVGITLAIILRRRRNQRMAMTDVGLGLQANAYSQHTLNFGGTELAEYNTIIYDEAITTSRNEAYITSNTFQVAGNEKNAAGATDAKDKTESLQSDDKEDYVVNQLIYERGDDQPENEYTYIHRPSGL